MLQKKLIIDKLVKKMRIGSLIPLMLTGLGLLILISIPTLFIIENLSNNPTSWHGTFWSIIFTVFSLGDFVELHPVSFIGKTIILVLGVAGIVAAALIFSEKVVEFVQMKIREAKGMGECKFKNHIIICGWNSRVKHITEELIYGLGNDVVLIADIDENPLPSFGNAKYMWIKGDPSYGEILERAGLKDASKAMIMAREVPDRTQNEIDAVSILTAIAVEKHVWEIDNQKDIYTIIELLNSKNAENAKRANVDDIIFPNDYASSILAMSLENPGFSQLLNDLINYEPRSKNSDSYAFYSLAIGSDLDASSEQKFKQEIMEKCDRKGVQVKEPFVFVGLIGKNKNFEIMLKYEPQKIISRQEWDSVVVIAGEKYMSGEKRR